MERLFENVSWEEREQIEDGYGNHVAGEWIPMFHTRAGFTYLRGSETVIASRLAGRQPVVVRVRSSKNTRRINNEWRMRDLRTGAIHAVRSIIPTDDRAFIDVTTETGTAT